jgi:cytochrome c oxidase subunit 3
VREPFSTAAQQREADMLGMYLFLASEVLLFGGLFAGALTYRILYPEAVVAASARLHVWIGAANTALLLTSSLLVALAVQAADCGLRRPAAALLSGAAGLGFGFLVLKAVEYTKEIHQGLLPGFGGRFDFSSPVEQLFMNLYLVGTGLHAAHMTVGIAILAGLAWRIGRRSLPLPERAVTVAVCGLYWHLVDIVWVFLYPVLYLAR